jgi:hypothetical protein
MFITGTSPGAIDTALAQQHSHGEPWQIGKLRRETP